MAQQTDDGCGWKPPPSKHTHTNSRTHMRASQVVSPLLGVVLKVARGDGKGKEMWSPQHLCDR